MIVCKLSPVSTRCENLQNLNNNLCFTLIAFVTILCMVVLALKYATKFFSSEIAFLLKSVAHLSNNQAR